MTSFWWKYTALPIDIQVIIKWYFWSLSVVYQWKMAYQYICHQPKCYQNCPYQVRIPIRRFVIRYFVLISTLSVNVFLSVISGTFKYAHLNEHQKLGGYPDFYQNRRWGFWEIEFLKTSGHSTFNIKSSTIWNYA